MEHRPANVGPSAVALDGKERQLDVVVASGAARAAPSERTVHAIGEAWAGETVGERHLRLLEQARAVLGPRASGARLLLFAPAFTPEIVAEAGKRGDVELVDLDPLYRGT